MTREHRKLLQSCLEGSASAEECDELTRLMAENDEILREWCAEIEICSALEWHYSIEKNLGDLIRRRVDLVDQLRDQQQRRARWISLAAAALVMLALGVYGLQQVINLRPSASFVANEFADWSLSHADGTSSRKSKLGKGDRITLRRGAVELEFPNHVRGVLEAPASLALLDRDRVALRSGKLYVEAHDPGARGFTVETPDLVAVDRGTRFGVVERPDSLAEVHVFEGLVEVSTPKGPRQKLTPGRAVRTDPVLKNVLRSIDADPKLFSIALPQGPPEVHLSFDETGNAGWPAADGRWNGLEVNRIGPAESPGITPVAGVFGQAARFSGDGTHLRIDGWSSPDSGEGQTIAFWIRLDPGLESPRNMAISSWGTPMPGSKGHWNLTASPAGAEILAGSGEGHGLVSSAPFSDGGWHHVACVSDPAISDDQLGNTRIYIDGTLSPAEKRLGGPAGVPRVDHFLIGALIVPELQTASNFNGDIDEFRIIQAALNEAEIRSLMRHNKVSAVGNPSKPVRSK